MLIYEALNGVFYNTFVFEAFNREFSKVLKSLIRMFLYHYRNLYLLNTEINIECYSLIVGGETLYVKYYTEMNSIWVEGCKSL